MKANLKTLQLYRAGSSNQGTPSVLLYLGKKVCFFLELPNRHNQTNISRIPAGTYLCKYLPRSASGKYKDVYHVVNVPGRSGILQHPGNFAGDKALGFKTHSWGCQLPALRMGRLNGQMAGLGSRAALRKLHQLTQRQDFYLEIR